MAINVRRLKNFILETEPLILLFYICISEFHTQFYYWKIFSFNLQFIIIYYWVLRDPDILGQGFIFLSGLINDVVLSLPLGTSELCYLFVSLIAAYPVASVLPWLLPAIVVTPPLEITILRILWFPPSATQRLVPSVVIALEL